MSAADARISTGLGIGSTTRPSTPRSVQIKRLDGFLNNSKNVEELVELIKNNPDEVKKLLIDLKEKLGEESLQKFINELHKVLPNEEGVEFAAITLQIQAAEKGKSLPEKITSPKLSIARKVGLVVAGLFLAIGLVLASPFLLVGIAILVLSGNGKMLSKIFKMVKDTFALLMPTSQILKLSRANSTASTVASRRSSRVSSKDLTPPPSP